jgi:sec-independent protein translocase protein TatC
VGSAILTPPDVVTQIMMALPLMLLYEISIIGARIFGKKKSEEDDNNDNK